MRRSAQAVFCGLGLFLSGCGFQPLYGEAVPGGLVSTELQSIKVGIMDSRTGIVMRNYLLDRLNPDGAPGSPRYRLSVRLREGRFGSGVRVDASVTRFNYRLIARYDLIEQSSGRVLYSDASESIVAYDVVNSQFATLISREDAQERAAVDVSDNIKLNLALYFQRRGTEPNINVSRAD